MFRRETFEAREARRAREAAEAELRRLTERGRKLDSFLDDLEEAFRSRAEGADE